MFLTYRWVQSHSVHPDSTQPLPPISSLQYGAVLSIYLSINCLLPNQYKLKELLFVNESLESVKKYIYNYYIIIYILIEPTRHLHVHVASCTLCSTYLKCLLQCKHYSFFIFIFLSNISPHNNRLFINS